jgi:hypothetical protein
MPSPNAQFFKPVLRFTHKGVLYEVVAYKEPNDERFFVEVLSGGVSVLITYPDGFKARLVYSVDPITAFDFQRATTCSAVKELMDTAESDIRRLL